MAPIDKVDEVEEVIQAGAEELYCGVLWEEWLKRYTIAAINRRVELAANLKSFGELKKCRDIAHSHGVPLCLTINEHYYTQEQYPFLLQYIQKAVDAGVDSFLVSDLALLLTLKEKRIDIPIHISTGGTTFNSETAKFYQNLGATRVTLPRHLTIGEIEHIIKEVPDLETTAFVLNSRCANVDGLCTFDHTPFKCPEPEKLLGKERVKAFSPHALSRDVLATGACMLPYTVAFVPSESAKRASEGERKAALLRQQVWDRFHIDQSPCGACALYEFKQMGITAVKIVGRGNPTKRKIGDIRFIRTLLSLLEKKGISKGEYREKARALYRYNYRRPCRTIMCYYPEVMPEEKVSV